MKFYIFTFSILVFTAFAVGEKASLPQTSRLCRGVTRDGVYRFDNQTRTCHRVGSRGPCGDLMIFYADPSSPDYGQCDCDISKRCNRHMMYWQPTDRCYFMYEQGPCPHRQWLVFGTNLKPTCEQDLCSIVQTEFDEDLGDQSFWIYHNRECVATGTEGHCPLPNEKLIINGFSHKVSPICSAITFYCKVPDVPSLVCVPGQKWHSLYGCNLWNPETIQHSPHIHGHGHHGQRHSHGWRHQHNHRKNFAPITTTTTTPYSFTRYPEVATPPPTRAPATRTPDIRRPDPLYNPAPGNRWGSRQSH